MAMDFYCDSHGPIVETEAGKVRGYRMDGIYNFRGIKYADARRFEMPQPVQPWEGVKDCFAFGAISSTIDPPPIFQRDITHAYRYWPQSEHCQYLNIWTHNTNNDVRRPVIVWIHGGGFTGGSAVEIKAYDLDQLCDYGDVVGVSITHRLNLVGFMNLSDFGEKYANSGNSSIADIVAALQWVKRNISKFGGDPDNVTIFGQSGGGSKITTLLQTPAADGLFEKAIIESGCRQMTFPINTNENSAAIGRAVVEELGLTRETVDKIQELPLEEVTKAWKKVAPRLYKEGYDLNWAPTQNGYYVGPPYVVGFTEHAKTIPMIVGTNIAEFPLVNIPDKDALSEDDIKATMKELYGEGAEKVLEEYKKAYPHKHPANVLFYDWSERVACQWFLDLKTGPDAAPCYNYLLTYDFQYNGGLPAWHSAELMLAFHQADTTPVTHEPIAQKLSDEMAKAWISMCWNGSPNNDLLPEWPKYTTEEKPVMVFDTVTEVKYDYDAGFIAEARKTGKVREMKPRF